MAIPPVSVPASEEYDLPRPRDVGILAMEVYFPRRVCIAHATPARPLTSPS